MRWCKVELEGDDGTWEMLNRLQFLGLQGCDRVWSV